MRLIKALLEGEGQKYDYGCVMLYFDFPQLEEIQSQIDENDLYTEEGDRTYGMESDPHCTLLYGIHEGVPTKKVQNLIDKVEFSPLKLNNVSLFENPKYDVLKFDVTGDGLNEGNSKLTSLPHTTEHDFHPHSTIAYLKPGTGKKYTQMFNDEEFDVVPTHGVYSKPNGDQDTIDISVIDDTNEF